MVATIMIMSSSRLPPYSLMIMLFAITCLIASASSSPYTDFNYGVSGSLPIVLEETKELFAEETDGEDESKSAGVRNVNKRNATGMYKIEGLLTEIRSSGFYYLPRNSTAIKAKDSSRIEGDNDGEQTGLRKNLFIGFWLVFALSYLLRVSMGP